MVVEERWPIPEEHFPTVTAFSGVVGQRSGMEDICTADGGSIHVYPSKFLRLSSIFPQQWQNSNTLADTVSHSVRINPWDSAELLE